MNESAIPPPLPKPPCLPREAPETRFCDLCHTPLDPTHEGRMCLECEGRAPTDRCPALDDVERADEQTSPGRDPSDPFTSAEFRAFFVRYEQCLDARFASMTSWLGEQLAEMHAALRQTCALAERAANSGIETVTINDRLDTIERRCARINGPFAGSMPPNGGSDA